MPSPPVIETAGLSKSYGSVRALDELSLRVEAGEIFGFLGPNGAGKTTTIRLLLGFLRPTRGAARILGRDTWDDAVRVHREVGYVPGDVRLYEGLTGRGLLELFMRLRRRHCEVESLAARLGLDLDKRIKSYSKGMRQKLGLIQALVHEPPLLVLDEPTAALDPLVQEEVYALVREHRERGGTVFFSSHVLSEVEKVCDRVGIVRAGRLLRVAQVEEVRGLHLRKVRVRFGDPAAALPRLREKGYAVSADGPFLEFSAGEDVDGLVKLLARHRIESLTIEPMSLEDVFFQYYRERDS